MSTGHKVAMSAGMETDSAETVDECVKPYGNIFLLRDFAGYTDMFPLGKVMFKAATISSR
jgi:hypothetical protein